MKLKYALIGASAVVAASQLAVGGLWNVGGQNIGDVSPSVANFLAAVPGGALLEDWEGYGAGSKQALVNPVGTPAILTLSALDSIGGGNPADIFVSDDSFNAAYPGFNYNGQFVPYSGTHIMAIEDGVYLRGDFSGSGVLGVGLILLDVDWNIDIQTIVTVGNGGGVIDSQVVAPAYGDNSPPGNEGSAGYSFIAFSVDPGTAITYFEVNPAGDGLLSNDKVDLVMFDDIYVPEPSEYALVAGLGLVGFGAWRRMRKAS